MPRPIHRRDALRTLSAATLAGGLPSLASAATTASLIAQITRSAIIEGRNADRDWAWFHPRGCMTPTANGPAVLITLQTIGGSDYFEHVHWMTSSDLGKTWTEPEPIPGMGRRPVDDKTQVGVCDVVPEYHWQTNSVLAMGHNVYYHGGRLARPQGPRWPVYAVRNQSGNWSARKKLVWNDPRGSQIYTCGCGQRVFLDDGDLLVALSFGPEGRKDRMVTSVRCAFDGETVTAKTTGNTLVNEAGRGLLEPSLTRLDGRFYMTIRAEDNRGYVSTSDDGLNWKPQRPWCWDDGKPLVMSTTQQHWLTHSDGLFLVYTRKAENNVNVARWRAPLFAAEVDRKTLRLRRDTEQVVLPLIGDGVGDAKNVARMGNFHVTNVTPEESWVTVGECLPANRWRGDLLLGRIHWAKPNQLG